MSINVKLDFIIAISVGIMSYIFMALFFQVMQTLVI